MTKNKTRDIHSKTQVSFPTIVLSVAFAFLLLLKLVFAVITEVAADEAYYWTWSQQLALSYYDHPPLNAWLLALTDLLFGTNKFGLRIGAG